MLGKKTAALVWTAAWLYEQEPGEPFDSSRLGEYVQRWVRWVEAGLMTKEKLPPERESFK